MIGGHTSLLVLNTGALRALCSALRSSRCATMTAFPDIKLTIAEYEDGTTIIGRIINNDKTSYLGGNQQSYRGVHREQSVVMYQ